MSVESSKTSLDEYKAIRWIRAAAQTFVIERALNRAKILISKFENQPQSSGERIKKAAVSLEQAGKTYDALKERAGKSVRSNLLSLCEFLCAFADVSAVMMFLVFFRGEFAGIHR